MLHIGKIIKAALKRSFDFLKKQIVISNSPSFSEDSYKTLIPIFANINSYLQTFLSVFSSSLMALNAALITVILSKETIISPAYLGFGMSFFIASILLYLVSFSILFKLRSELIDYSKEENIDFKNISFSTENKMSSYISFMFMAAIFFFFSFLLLLKSIIG